METIHHAEIIINIFLQSLGSWLTLVSQFFSFLGQEEFYILVMPALYWCINSSWGIRIGIMLILTGSLNSWLKVAFASPRPFWIDGRVKELVVETSFGFPSGHAMNSTSMWGLAAGLFRKKWASYFVIGMVFLIGLSRIALGVHFTSDVLGGWLAGGLLLTAFLKWQKPIANWIARTSYLERLALCVVSSLIILAVSGILLGLRSTWMPPVDWLANAPDMNPLDPSGPVTLAGVWLGLSLSITWWQQKYDALKPGKSVRANLLRYLVGIAGLFIIWYGLGLMFAGGADMISLALRYVRYALVGTWVGGFAPLLFQKIKV
jgi:membrane-associated phospholipid phosphatase